MVGEFDKKDKKESKKMAIAMISLVLLLFAALALMLPELTEMMDLHFSPGLGLKDAAVISFFVTIVLLILFAVASGDGLLGELQFILGSFFLFFVIIWLSLAWIF